MEAEWDKDAVTDTLNRSRISYKFLNSRLQSESEFFGFKRNSLSFEVKRLESPETVNQAVFELGTVAQDAELADAVRAMAEAFGLMPRDRNN